LRVAVLHIAGCETECLARLRLKLSRLQPPNVATSSVKLYKFFTLIHAAQRHGSKMSGYEKLAGLMAKHSEVATFQRFDFLNTLNILYLQAELVHLERELRNSMREDLESGNNAPSETPNETGSSVDLGGAEEIESAHNADNDEAGNDMEKRPLSQIESRSVSGASEINERLESGRDWYFLANMDDSSTWEIMLKTRDKLKEYSLTHFVPEIKISILTNS
jgi:hypothetical protein